MSPQSRSLAELINLVRSRIRARRVLGGVLITLVTVAVALVIASLVAGSVSRKPVILLLLRFMPLVLGIAAGMLFIARPLKARYSDAQIARLIEEKRRLNDSLVTAVEYSADTRGSSPAVVNRLINDTSERAATLKPDHIIDPRPAYAYGGVSALILFLMLGILVIGPASLSSGLATLYSNSEDSVLANAMAIKVSPGSARVPRGSDQKIKASLSGFDAESAQVFTRKEGADNWVAEPMEPAKAEGEFQLLIFNIQDSINYYIEAKGIRSPEFALEVANLPFVKQIDLVLNFPAYTRAASKKIENGGEVATLKGTVVSVIAQLSASAKAARIVLNDGTRIEMSPTGDGEFTGRFTVTQNGSYRVELVSEDGEAYNGSMEYDITVLEDHVPTVVIDKPGRDMKVTSIQEVFAQVRADDDYGVSEIELYYSVNGGEEKRVKLQDIKSDTPRTLSGSHTFFLEEYSLQPGDFISYYAKARDNAATGAQESTSDIYFMEVRPFDRQFRQASQQGGGGEGDQDSNALTRRQREIIAATFRVQREQNSYTPEEKSENFSAVTLSQEKLKTDAEGLAERIRRRLGENINSQPDFAKLIEHLAQAAKEMDAASAQLRAQNTKEAMPAEQRALQQLLKAEAIFRDIQVAMNNSQGQGKSQDSENLADLFELQLDKMKNQYETVQSQQQSQQNQQQDEIARRLQELARRQQQQMEQQMRMQQRGGGGGGGQQRQQQEMIEEAKKMARELERLSRERRDPKLAEAARQMQQAAEDMQRAQAASSSSSSSSSSSQSGQSGQSSQEATAQQMRALERMEQARRSLENAQRAGGQQSAQQLRQQAEEALKRQDEIAKDVDELARNARNGQSGQSAEEKKQQLSDRKQALADKMSGLERDIDQTARAMGQNQQAASDKLRQAANAIRQNRIPDRIRQNGQMIENGWYDQAREREQVIRGNIEDVLKNLQAAEGSGKQKNQGEGLEDALNRARELADNLDSLRRRLESGNQGQQAGNQQNGQGQQQNQSGQNQSGQNQSGQQAQNGSRSQSRGNQSQQQNGQQAGNQQNGQGRQSQGQQGQRGQQSSQSQGQQGQQGQRGQSGQQGQQGQQSGGQQGQQGQQQGGQQAGGQAQPGQGQRGQNQNSQPSMQSADSTQAGGGPPRSGDRQLESEIRQRIGEAEELSKIIGKNSELGRQLNQAIEQLKKINPEAFNDPAQLALLKNEVIDPLRLIEVELARKLQSRLGNNGPGALSDGDAPDRYRKLIEEYYRRLSARSPEQKP